MNTKTNVKMSRQIENLKQVLLSFNQQNINYCILRNYEFLLGEPFPLESIDITIAETDFSRAEAILKENGFNKRKQQFSLRHKAFFKIEEQKYCSFDVQVGGVYWNDMPYYRESILKNRIKKSFFFTPNDNDYFVMLIAHSILGKRYFKEKYESILTNLLKEKKISREYCLNKLSEIFNKRIAQHIFENIDNQSFNKINIPSIVIYFIFYTPKHTITISKLFLRWVKWKKFLKPWPLISIVGPDGAGKSTAVDCLNSFLQETGRKTAVVYTGRGREHILPITLLGNRYKSSENKTEEGALTEKNNEKKEVTLKKKGLYTFGSHIFTLDLLLRYYFKIFPKRISKKIVITDRYCSDIILMKNVPFWYKRILMGIFPRPTTSILLHNSAEVLHLRRPKETVEELERQLSIFNRLAYDLKLKTADADKTHREINEFVLNKLLREWY